MLRIAVQAKGRLFEDTMELLAEAGYPNGFSCRFGLCISRLAHVLPSYLLVSAVSSHSETTR